MWPRPSLLLPSPVFEADALAAGFTAAGLDALYDLYLVSWGALLVRFTEWLPEASLALWRSGVRPGDGDGLRVVRCYGRGPAWLPDGMSERFLSAPLARSAKHDGVAYASDLRIMRSANLPPAAGVACRFPALRDRRVVRWHGRLIPEDLAARAEVAVLLVPEGARWAAEALAVAPGDAAAPRRTGPTGLQLELAC